MSLAPAQPVTVLTMTSDDAVAAVDSFRDGFRSTTDIVTFTAAFTHQLLVTFPAGQDFAVHTGPLNGQRALWIDTADHVGMWLGVGPIRHDELAAQPTFDALVTLMARRVTYLARKAAGLCAPF